jgi:hypothetical protein
VPLLLAFAGCTPDAALGDRGPTAAMDFTRQGSFWDAPFPSVGADVHGFPNPDGLAVVDLLVELAAGRDGAATTAGVGLRTEAPVDDLDAAASLDPDAPVRLVVLDGPRAGEQLPVDVRWLEHGGKYGADSLLVALPVQGVPLAPGALHALVVSTTTGLARSPVLDLLEVGAPAGLSAADAAAYRAADHLHPDAAALAVFRAGDPTAELRRAVAQARPLARPPHDLVLTDVFDDYCAFEGLVELPVFQGGEPPFLTEGGGWVTDGSGELVLQRTETGRFWLTLPRRAPPPGGWPVAAMIRTGGGGDRPLVDRGVRDALGYAVPGTGPAVAITAAGFVGLSFDGVHGGLRNITGGDEQFLMFNVTNLEAVRDNVRQSALEVALLPDWLPALALDASGCPGAGALALDVDHVALVGHSMGATIAPLALAVEPRFGAAVMSGAGGSWLENLVWKQKPLTVAPLAAAMLGLPEVHEHEPVLQLVQWTAEDADPPPYLWDLRDRHLLVFQGIVDHYILPPIASATNLSAHLDLGGPPLDEVTAELDVHRPLRELLPLTGRGLVDLPVAGNRDGVTAIVVQHAEDGVEDGHEVFFQLEASQRQLRTFLQTWVDDGVPTVE